MDEQLDLSLLSEDEAEAFKKEPPIGDESESTSEEEPVEKVEEPSPPPKIEEPPKEPAPVKVGEPIQEPPKVPEPKPPTIDGIIAKDGKNFIPFSVLEEERAAKKAAVEEKQRLETEIAELKKPKASVVTPPPVVVAPPEPRAEPDFKVLGKKLYESEEGAAEVLKEIFHAGKKAGQESGAKAAETTTTEHEFKREVTRIKTANPWIQKGLMENTIVGRAQELLVERGLVDDNGNIKDDLSAVIRVAEDAVAEGRKTFRIDEPKVDLQVEIDKAVKAAVDKNTKEILAKFNIKEPDAVTLANVRNLNPDITSKFDEIMKKSGIDYEEAVGQLTPEEREAFEANLP